MGRRPPSLKVPAIALVRSSGVALHRQLYLVLRELILTGRLREGERLPSSRALAKVLRISRNTVVNAYERLAEKNFAVATIGSGTRVAISSAYAPGSGFLQHAFVRKGEPDPAGNRSYTFKLISILRGSRYAVRRAIFLDHEGNSLYLYNAYLT